MPATRASAGRCVAFVADITKENCFCTSVPTSSVDYVTMVRFSTAAVSYLPKDIFYAITPTSTLETPLHPYYKCFLCHVPLPPPPSAGIRS
jgi:hypothetical protein